MYLHVHITFLYQSGLTVPDYLMTKCPIQKTILERYNEELKDLPLLPLRFALMLLLLFFFFMLLP
jgi:hypothetical protein